MVNPPPPLGPLFAQLLQEMTAYDQIMLNGRTYEQVDGRFTPVDVPVEAYMNGEPISFAENFNVYFTAGGMVRGPRFSPAQLYQQRSGTDPKGRELMRSLLTEKQLEQLDRDGCFDVTGSLGGLYRIKCTSFAYNVTRVHRGTKREMYDLCAGPSYVTHNDYWLAQKLMIEADEKTFRRIANVGLQRKQEQPPGGTAPGGFRRKKMIMLMTPVNLITELDDDSSQSYVRRVVARILGHAEITLGEAKELWIAFGLPEDLWGRYTDTILALR